MGGSTAGRAGTEEEEEEAMSVTDDEARQVLQDQIIELKQALERRLCPDANEGWRPLADLMSQESERRWSAGWCTNLEYILWRDIGYADDPYRNPEEIVTLISLALLARELGGWVVWDETAERQTRFVPLSEWTAMYQAWLVRQ